MESERQDELSIALPCEPRMIQHKYDSYDEYMYTIWPLILIEFFAQVSWEIFAFYDEKLSLMLARFLASYGEVYFYEVVSRCRPRR